MVSLRRSGSTFSVDDSVCRLSSLFRQKEFGFGTGEAASQVRNDLLDPVDVRRCHFLPLSSGQSSMLGLLKGHVPWETGMESLDFDPLLFCPAA